MLSIKLKGKKIAYYLSLLCMLIALSCFAQGGYLLIKANFSQYLLEKSWQQSVANNFKIESITKPWPWADVHPIAKLSFERLDISQIVMNNDSGQALAFGPGLTFANVSASVFVISAHNDTHFSILSKLKLNDRITLTLKSGQTQVFKVDNIKILDIKTDQLAVINDEDNDEPSVHVFPKIKELVLVTCYPFAGVSADSTLRYMVHLS
jgi:sortase A